MRWYLDRLIFLVDPVVPNAADRAQKLRSQQEVCSLCFRLALAYTLKRQGLAYILVRQATSLLQRTKLNVTVSCQAWHAKNARHMLLGECTRGCNTFSYAHQTSRTTLSL